MYLTSSIQGEGDEGMPFQDPPNSVCEDSVRCDLHCKLLLDKPVMSITEVIKFPSGFWRFESTSLILQVEADRRPFSPQLESHGHFLTVLSTC